MLCVYLGSGFVCLLCLRGRLRVRNLCKKKIYSSSKLFLEILFLYSKNKREIKSCYEYKERVDPFLYKKRKRQVINRATVN